MLVKVKGLAVGWGSAQFYNNRPYPTYSLESMPDTDFTCRDKILGGYYADSQAQCQMFHICVKVSGVGVQDFRFLCPNGTAFDQDHQICAEWDDVDCDATTLYYASDNFDLYRLGSGYESKAVKYGEDEETFSLQRAETGDARLSREHQAQRVNQQKDFSNRKFNSGGSDRDIFKTSSSSNFFNNRNGGKELDEDEDDGNVNANQNRDNVQKRKLIRKQNRRPQEQDFQKAQTQRPQQQQDYQKSQTQRPQQQQDYQKAQTQRPQQQQDYQKTQTQRPQQQQDYQKAQTQRPQQQQDYQKAQTQRPQQQQDFQKTQTQRPQQQENYPKQQDYQKTQTQRPQQQENYPKQQQQDFQKTQTQRPQQQENYSRQQQRQQQQDFQKSQTQKPQPQENYPKQQQRQQQTRPQVQQQQQQRNQRPQQNFDSQTSRPSRPTGFANNFAGSSYIPTTSRPTSTTNNINAEQYTTAINNFRARNSQRRPNPNRQQYNDADNFRQTPQQNPSTSFAASTPAPFRQTQQYNRNPTTSAPKTAETENYPPSFNKQSFSTTQQKPSPFKVQPQSAKQSFPTTPVAQNSSPDTHYDIPKVKPSKQTENYPKDIQGPTTFAPKTNSFAYTQSTQFNKQQDFSKINTKQTTPQAQSTQFTNNNNQFNTPAAPGHNRPFANQFNSQKQTTQYTQQSSTPKSTTHTQYTPTVPKVSSTTPISRSNRFDETQYDDGSYSSKYDNDENNSNKEDEFLKTAHSQNIASSRNEYIKNAQKTTVATTTQKPFYSESPRPFSTNANTPRVTEYPKTTKTAPKPIEKKPEIKEQKPKSEKNVSYDYAYYDSNVGGGEHEYDIDTDFKKTTTK
ncbi:PREDICTED: putative mediator of RNA polymerase II transcription subunit 26 isoform X2 [Nicrophorus vespilloides]|uniref:Mediator of RNA polymerase II transcription subunit 26 isoform X2 n=1 Tax=Nicrophorus vespilloides TaxID=110193 RepID=A0ABM1NCJ0_NICVS|nr:PREDICTED: putative mediator of RNA polymerase II transcription subunit 26 isoform X2 [Nicrophorus vespilloides]